MNTWISIFIALSIKAFSKIFFRTKVEFINPAEDFWDDINVFSFLNHTSLVEPLLFSSVPNSFIYKNMKRAVVPGADITLSRPIVGSFYKFIFPQMISISRKRDKTWVDFMNQVKPDSLVVVAPEGRMMRENGLDKYGKPMSIRTGIADILKKTEAGHIVLAYSGGLHHVQKPGEKFIRLFKTIKISYEKINIKDYKESLKSEEQNFHKRLISDLNLRMKRNVPQ